MRLGRIAAVVFALALFGAACDDGDDKADDSRPADDSEEISRGTFLIEPRDGEEETDDDESTDDDEDAQPPRTDPDEESEEEDPSDGGATGEFETVTDSTETVEVDVPSHWTDLADAGVDEDDDGTTDSGFGLAVATDLEEWVDTWGVSGLIFSATAEPDAPVIAGDFEAVFEANAYPDECVDDGVEAFTSDTYEGEIQYWSDCAGSGTQWVVLAAAAADGSHGVILTVALAPEDEAALDTILESLSVNTPIDG